MINFDIQSTIYVIFVKIIDDVMKHRLLYIILSLFTSVNIAAQVKVAEGIEVDKSVHNFGDVKLKSGPISCSFTISNTSNSPIVIYQVSTSCGCTDADWTKEPILPGKKGKISVKYSNDEGPYPFDKTLTVYVSNVKKPILLKIRGTSVENVQKLEESYSEKFGPLAFKHLDFNCGHLYQGGVKHDAALVANLSDKPIDVTFQDISDNLEISVSPNPIPARSTAEISFSVTADRQLWGKNKYSATPVINGKTYGTKKLWVSAFTRENFETLTDAERSNGPRPQFKESTFPAGKVKKGDTIHAQFTFENIGQKSFGVYKVDIDALKWSHGRIPPTPPGKSTTFSVDINTSNMPLGEMLVIVTLTTNSPLRPIVNLFITGWIE